MNALLTVALVLVLYVVTGVFVVFCAMGVAWCKFHWPEIRVFVGTFFRGP